MTDGMYPQDANVLNLADYVDWRQPHQDPEISLFRPSQWLDLNHRCLDQPVNIRRWFHATSVRRINIHVAKAFKHGFVERQGNSYKQVFGSIIRNHSTWSYCFWMDFTQQMPYKAIVHQSRFEGAMARLDLGKIYHLCFENTGTWMPHEHESYPEFSDAMNYRPDFGPGS